MPPQTPAHHFQNTRKMIFSRSLKKFPSSSREEKLGTRFMERLLYSLQSPIIIHYPLTKLRVELNQLIGPRLSYLISIGDYERSDIELIDTHVLRGHKVLEIGAGAGVTAAQIVRKTKRRVVVVDPDSRLEALVKKQTHLNNGSAFFVNACVVADEESKIKKIKFFIAEDLCFSSIYKGKTKKVSSIFAPTIGLNSLLKKFRPDILMMDIEGAESALFVAPLVHKPKKIIIEIHSPTFGEKTAKLVIRRILQQGYKVKDLKCWTYVFERKTSL